MELTRFNAHQIFHSNRIEYGLLTAKLQIIKDKYSMNLKDLESLFSVNNPADSSLLRIILEGFMEMIILNNNVPGISPKVM